MSSRVRLRWALGCAAVAVLLLTVSVLTVSGLARAATEQTQIGKAITADISYRNGSMVTSGESSSFRRPTVPTQVTGAEKGYLAHAPVATTMPDTFVGFRTSIDVTSMTRTGDHIVVDFTETTTMRRLQPLPDYGYAIPQVATLIKRDGAWLVDAIAFAPGSGMDGADCMPGRWAGAC